MKRMVPLLAAIALCGACMNWSDARSGYCSKHPGFCDDGGVPVDGGGGGEGGGEGGGAGGGEGGGLGGGAGGGVGGGSGGGGGQQFDAGEPDGGAFDAGPSDGFRTLFAVSGGDPATAPNGLWVRGVAAAGPDTAVAIDFKNAGGPDAGITFGGLRIGSAGNPGATCIAFVDSNGGVSLPIRPDGGQPTCILTGGSISVDQMIGMGDGTVAVVGGIASGNGSLYETGTVGAGLNGVGYAAVVSSDGGIWGKTFPAFAIATAVATNGKYVVIAGPYSGTMTINSQVSGQKGAFIAIQNMNGTPVTALFTDCNVDTSYVAHVFVDANDNIILSTTSPSGPVSCTLKSTAEAFTTRQAGMFRLRHVFGTNWSFDWSSPEPVVEIAAGNGTLFGAVSYLGKVTFSDGGTVSGDPPDAGGDGGYSILLESIDPTNGQVVAASRAPFLNGAGVVQIQARPSGGWLLANVPCAGCSAASQGPGLLEFGADLSWGASFVAPPFLNNRPLVLDVGPDGALRVGGQVSGTLTLPPPIGADAGVLIGNQNPNGPDIWVAKIRPPQ